MHTTSPEFLKFVNSYLATAAWVDIDSDSEPNNGEFTKTARKLAEEDCKQFVLKVRDEFTKEEAKIILERKGNDVDYLAPHELFLTRNGHAAGFWDGCKGWDDLAENAGARLTKIANSMGSINVVVHRKRLIFG